MPMTVNREALAHALREARANHGMSQEAAAKRVGLSRTVLAQIELGNRRVSEDELERFASLYKTSVAKFVGPDPAAAELSDFSIAELAPEMFLDKKTNSSVSGVLSLLNVACELEQALGRKSPQLPHYALPAPSTTADAIAQGEGIAQQERRRLELQSAPAPSAVGLVASQGIRVATTELPDGLTCLFVHVPEAGASVIIANTSYDDVQRRFAVLQAYAHVLFERRRVVRTTTRGNANELIAKRATAFATAFLLPESGVRNVLASLGKGLPSRKGFVVFDAQTDELTRAEQRVAPGSQTITFADVAAIAESFGASYKVAVVRLLSLGLISETESHELFSTKAQDAADRLLAVKRPHAEGSLLLDDRSGLKADVLHLAIEAYRRELITKDRLAEIGQMLKLADLPKAKLLELAQAAR
jgi:transcriptional regulator with XRE-family HTH domain/Zn-dependent peptidase ImmA (M78 family)